jgi:hypothetical protein
VGSLERASMPSTRRGRSRSSRLPPRRLSPGQRSRRRLRVLRSPSRGCMHAYDEERPGCSHSREADGRTRRRIRVMVGSTRAA